MMIKMMMTMMRREGVDENAEDEDDDKDNDNLLPNKRSDSNI